jgi:hypothetical protein
VPHPETDPASGVGTKGHECSLDVARKFRRHRQRLQDRSDQTGDQSRGQRKTRRRRRRDSAPREIRDRPPRRRGRRPDGQNTLENESADIRALGLDQSGVIARRRGLHHLALRFYNQSLKIAS